MKIAILGYGVEGQAAYEYWRDGNELTICDQNPDLEVPAGAGSQLGPGYLQNLDQFDLIVRSPNLHYSDIVNANGDVVLDKITTNTNEFLKVCPTKNVIGVTGTKGKGTTSTLIAKMLEAGGKRVHLGGNIGVAPLEMLENDIQPEDWVVLELSSFQLIDLKQSPHIAVCLMVVPEHLDWHPDIKEYTEAKSQLFAHQNMDDIAIYFGENEQSRLIAEAGQGQKVPYFAEPGAVVKDGSIQIEDQVVCQINELKLLGKHNWQNVCAAVTAVWQAGVRDVPALHSVLSNFKGLEHRLELVRELKGVSYYDDSFGTTPETAIVAIEALAAPKVVILGGGSKGADFTELAQTVKDSNVHHIVLIGNPDNPDHPSDSPKILAALQAVGFDAITNLIKPGGPTMTEIVAAAQAAAQPGDAVLLSAACTSFDIFKNYKDRGEQFSAAVRALA
ncbi:MAG TPA: UDP-N-acetylmuramoyl-L-alanine--D-glutamate ligase [Candidatus Saccharimonadales bacterium]|nr:UDP-N-acetylmuramoyl-L-alanine--D-glutamate ligase [Candidatus Saccharimonadales bacterium]